MDEGGHDLPELRPFWPVILPADLFSHCSGDPCSGALLSGRGPGMEAGKQPDVPKLGASRRMRRQALDNLDEKRAS